MSKSLIPNMFTFSNLACGVFSLLMLFKGKLEAACIFILLAAIIDRYDGRVARFLNVSSEIGKELDSLADLVSFGVAPAMLLYILSQYENLGIIGYILIILFPIAGAYRLARYNISSFDGVFTGVPITIAGSVVALYSLILLIANIDASKMIIISTILYLLFSYLMVSKIKFTKV